jgi:hypothetical protein
MSVTPLLHSFAYALDYLREQVDDVLPADMVAQPGGIANHPMWTLGHVAYACELLGGVAGLAPWLPADWARRFGTGSQPEADLDAYPRKMEVLEVLADARARLARAVEALTDAQLDQPFPDPSYVEMFPTVRHALTQVMVGHMAYHVGQVSVWRKAMGLPRMKRVFE